MPVVCMLNLMREMYEDAFRRACLCDECMAWKSEWKDKHPEEQEEDDE